MLPSTRFKLKIMALIWTIYFILQHLLWFNPIKNLVCQKDNVLYSNFMWTMHDWFKEHSSISNIIFKTPNHMAINGFYFYIMIRFIIDGARIECGIANNFFHILRNICIRTTALDHPLDNLQTTCPNFPGAQSPKFFPNDYYFSGHVGTATMAFCFAAQYENKTIQ